MKRILFVLCLAVGVWAVWYFVFDNRTESVSVPHSAPNAPVSKAPSAGALGQRTKESGCLVRQNLPDPECTPGAVREATLEEICTPGTASLYRKQSPPSVHRKVFLEYGIARREKGEYEDDHLISLELGGSNDIANRWPEAANPGEGLPGFREKDKVENYLHRRVCIDKDLDLRAAQYQIATDWIAIYNSMPARWK